MISPELRSFKWQENSNFLISKFKSLKIKLDHQKIILNLIRRNSPTIHNFIHNPDFNRKNIHFLWLQKLSHVKFFSYKHLFFSDKNYNNTTISFCLTHKYKTRSNKYNKSNIQQKCYICCFWMKQIRKVQHTSYTINFSIEELFVVSCCCDYCLSWLRSDVTALLLEYVTTALSLFY